MNKGNSTSEDILLCHYKRVNKEFQIQMLKGKIAKKRILYPSGLQDDGKDMKELIPYCNQRQVLTDEIAIDLDGNTTMENGALQIEAEHRLNLRGYSYELWHSGGKGLHIHMFFPEFLEMKEMQRKYVRAKMLAIFKDLKADQQMKSERVNIQMENAPHRKTFMPKTLLNVKAGRRHKIPKQWMQEALRAPERPLKGTFIRSSGKVSPKVKKLLNAVLTDARKRVSFYLAAHLRNAYNDKDKVFEILSQWNDRQTRRISEWNLKSTINSVFNSNETPGDQYLEDVLYQVEVIE